MNNLMEAFEDLIKDCYNSEKQLEKALPKMIAKASNPELKAALQAHLEQTKSQTTRVEDVAKECGFKPTGVVCKGMQGIIAEGDEHMSEGDSGPAMDAVIIACAQKVEHYEIVNYGTARTWARELGLEKVVPILETILDEEADADEKLNRMALKKINEAALQGSGVEACETPKAKASLK